MDFQHTCGVTENQWAAFYESIFKANIKAGHDLYTLQLPVKLTNP